MPQGRVWGATLMVVGAFLSSSAGLALLLSAGLDETFATSSPGSASTATPTEPPAQEAGPTPDSDEVERFVGALFEAMQNGDGAYLFTALDPRVLDLYGPRQCRRHTRDFSDPTATADVEKVRRPAPWDWVTDNRTITVADSYAVALTDSAAGSNDEGDIQIGLSAKGLGWFTDCGTPRR